ncbi:hypothetical protein [Faecalitalea cylindroides]|uniref:hypothetical protein n=1 Tax=Faecalitalea cylindroides TaxID=39483 RepID=UPI001957C423|nr:hypothetical protein [Faecalitalea cylindroides]
MKSYESQIRRLKKPQGNQGSGNDQEKIQTKDRQGSCDDDMCPDRIQTTGIDHKQRRRR